MADRVQDWVRLVDELYPVADAAAWDSVGLQVGDPTDEVGTVLMCLDVTVETLGEAVARKAQLVVAHHPLLFRPLDRLTPDSAAGRLALDAARARIAVLAAHTNLDVAHAGTTAPIMSVLGIADSRPLAPAPARPFVKVVVFVPVGSTDAVLAAAFAAGGGAIGDYDECSFRVTGTGTFRPSAAANPTLGERERRNEVAEDRVEVVVPAAAMAPVVTAVRAAHPYEEVALDVYPLAAIATEPAAPKGLGRVGDLDRPLALRDVAARLRQGLPSPLLRMAGDPDRMIRRVAACGGAGDALIGAALSSGADVYVTGDLRHHVTLDALTMGMAMIDAGHYATEAAALPAFADSLAAAAAARGLGARLLASDTSTDPWLVDGGQEDQQR